jgi:membrane-bound serine protease (ClpP class)
MIVGVYGLIFEFANPGTIGPGVIGAVCLILGLYALNVLPLNGAGLALVLLGLAFMIGEAFVPSFGLLGIGGAVAFVFGAAILFDTDVPAFQLGWPTIALAAAASAGVLIFLLGYLWRAHRRPVTTGAEDFAHARATVDDWQAGQGHVRLHGERWNARGPADLAPGESVAVTGQDGLMLTVDRTGDRPGDSETPPPGPTDLRERPA